MKIILRLTLCAIICHTPLVLTASDEEPSKQSGVDVQGELTAEAQAAAEELRRALPPGSEAIAMLDDILKGSHLSAEDGWFPLAQAQSLLDWDHVLQVYDNNADDLVTRTEFPGSDDDFSRLDRSRDGVLKRDDLTFDQHSLAPSPGLQLFFMADENANGKLTREEFAALYDSFASSDQEYLSLDEMREQLAPPPQGARDQRADRPSRSTLVIGLKNQEIGSLQPGPKAGEEAPDFTLQDLQGNKVTLSEEIGDQPVVLIFGNFTCGPFRSQAGNIEQLAKRYQDRAKFFLVYVREAHPEDGWWMLSNQRAGIKLPQPTNWKERREVAATCREHLDLEIPMLVDDIDDTVGARYSGMPNRLYLIDQQGKIVFKNGRGPFGFHPRQLEQALVLLLNENSDRESDSP